MRAAPVVAVVVLAAVWASPSWADRCGDATAAAVDQLQRSNARLELLRQRYNHVGERAIANREAFDAQLDETAREGVPAGGDYSPRQERVMRLLYGAVADREILFRDLYLIAADLDAAWIDRQSILSGVLQACRP